MIVVFDRRFWSLDPLRELRVESSRVSFETTWRHWDSAVFHNMHLGGRDALCVVPSTWWKSAECFSVHGISQERVRGFMSCRSLQTCVFVAICVRRSVSGSRFFLKDSVRADCRNCVKCAYLRMWKRCCGIVSFSRYCKNAMFMGMAVQRERWLRVCTTCRTFGVVSLL